MTAHQIDPVLDPRWSEFIKRQPHTTIFHTPAWLEVLRRAYGYEALALTTASPSEDLSNGLVVCRVHSWLTGRRLVSLPFSDHCEPLAENTEALRCLMAGLKKRANAEGCRYVELRPKFALAGLKSDFQTSQKSYLHLLDLRPGKTEVFRRFHKDCIQRKIRRAQREGIGITVGRDSETVSKFYNLVLQTRRRQGLPPQPVSWFRCIIDCLGESASIRYASKDGRPIAGILTLQYGKTLTYKYGASEARFHNLGAMPYLLWRAIEDAISCGLEELDMGRSDCDDLGLVAFKEHWKATRSVLSYCRFPADAPKPDSESIWKRRVAGTLFSHMPARCLATVGKFLYRHIA
jgi:hypothetical protein